MDVSDEISNVATAPKEPVMDPQAPSLNSPSGTLIDEKPSRGNKGRDGDGNGARRQEYRAQSNSRGHGKGGGRGASFSRNKRSDMGRAEWSRNAIDKRARNEASQEAMKRQKANDGEGFIPRHGLQFSKEEIDAEGKRPKRKVAVLMGYSGTGYKGMQLNYRERTIEGDLFNAFVAAGAVSKANADDPKKSSLVRCARTDKGVHAAGNVISMKLIIEDVDLVKKVNEQLSPQIRVFGIERTIGSFNAYQVCDSRIYEYLIPTHAFIPPHPNSYLGKKLVELAKEAGDCEAFEKRQNEVSIFWIEVEDQHIKPILDRLNPATRQIVLKALYNGDMKTARKPASTKTVKAGDLENQASINTEILEELNSETPVSANGDTNAVVNKDVEKSLDQTSAIPETKDDNISIKPLIANDENSQTENSGPKDLTLSKDKDHEVEGLGKATKDLPDLELAIRQLKAAYIAAKKAYRIHPDRLARVRSALSQFVGSRNFHNYTVDKKFVDPSAKRFIKSFIVQDAPIVTNGTEWLSLKVQGQSFMMHQIRKMVSMAALVVRCGCHERRLQDSYMKEKISIPKAPGLGLLLERPVFDVYNQHSEDQQGRKTIDLHKYEKEMQEFKQREIYDRIFREEERDNQFHAFFASIDNVKSPRFLYLSSMGIPAATSATPAQADDPDAKEGIVDESSSEEKDADG